MIRLMIFDTIMVVINAFQIHCIMVPIIIQTDPLTGFLPLLTYRQNLEHTLSTNHLVRTSLSGRTSVGPHVPSEITLLRKFPITVPTLVRLLTSVGPHVPFESTLVRKFPIAVPTLEGFLTSVGQHVCSEMTLLTKFPIATPTLEGILFTVHPHVLLETLLYKKFLITVLTLERPLTRVGLHDIVCF